MSGGEKTIRVWHGCKVVGLVSFSDTGSSHTGAVGGAANSTVVDIEIDPWAGLIVDHATRMSPCGYRDEYAETVDALNSGARLPE